MKISWYRHKVIWVILLLIVSGISCEKQPGKNGGNSQSDLDPNNQVVNIDSGTFLTMGTFGRIQIRCGDEQMGRRALAEAMAALEAVDQRFSTYRDDSELARVNQLAAKQPVAISEETYCLLQKAQAYSQLTNGAFDITVTPLIRLWKEAEKENRLPTEAEITEAKTKVGFEKLKLAATDPPTVAFVVEGMELNVDAIAKGYAVDQALGVLRQPGIIAGLVDIGGEVSAFGQNRPGTDWIIGIQDPTATKKADPLSQQPRWLIRLQDCAVATSGNYRQYIQINAKHYSHIIDPRTGWPADILPSVTVIAPTTVDADTLATAISVMGCEKGLELVESLDNIEAFLIAEKDEKPQIYRSSGFSRYEVLRYPFDR